MKIFNFFTAILLAGLSAKANYVFDWNTWTYKFVGRYLSNEANGSNHACDEVVGKFLPQHQKFRALNSELQLLLHGPSPLDQVQQINELTRQISKITGEMVASAKPEWNSEDYDLNISWRLKTGSDDEVKAVRISYLEFLGELRPDLVKFVEPHLLYFFGPILSYHKKVSLLEYCELIRSLEIGIETDVETKYFDRLKLKHTEYLSLVKEE